MDISELQVGFKDVYDTDATNFFFSPGRINLIGEHTDYNGGHVFPAAISLGTYAAVSPSKDNELHFFSANYPKNGEVVVSLTNLEYKKEDSWTNYLKGMFTFLDQTPDQDAYSFGLNIYIKGNLPAASGLSSSASMEMLAGIIITSMYDIEIDPLEIVQTGKQVENEYIGVNSGIMDQFAVEMGKKNQAVFLDTNTLEYKLFPINLEDMSIVIMNTNKPRNLVDGKYNERRAECEEALTRLQDVVNIESLGELDEKSFDEYCYAIGDETLIKRARHAVIENQRTIRAGEAMTNNDLQQFGRLMNASHISLEYDYEVTGIELDTLVHTAWQQDGVLGARMTGAGFGGCGIALVENDAIDNLKKEVTAAYEKATDFSPSFYITEISDGPIELF